MAKNQGVEVKDVAKSGYKNSCQLVAVPGLRELLVGHRCDYIRKYPEHS